MPLTLLTWFQLQLVPAITIDVYPKVYFFKEAHQSNLQWKLTWYDLPNETGLTQYGQVTPYAVINLDIID